LKNEVYFAKQAANDHKAKMDNALTPFQKAQERIWENPDLSSEQERFTYSKAKIAFEEKNREFKKLLNELEKVKKNMEIEQTVLKDIQTELNHLAQRLNAGDFARYKAKKMYMVMLDVSNVLIKSVKKPLCKMLWLKRYSKI